MIPSLLPNHFLDAFTVQSGDRIVIRAPVAFQTVNVVWANERVNFPHCIEMGVGADVGKQLVKAFDWMCRQAMQNVL